MSSFKKGDTVYTVYNHFREGPQIVKGTVRTVGPIDFTVKWERMGLGTRSLFLLDHPNVFASPDEAVEAFLGWRLKELKNIEARAKRLRQLIKKLERMSHE